MIYVDISNYYATRANTGIQRVIKEFLIRSLKTKKIVIKCIAYDVNQRSFIQISSNEIAKFLKNTKDHEFKKNKPIQLEKVISSNDVYLDMDGNWNCPLKRLFLYKKLKDLNVKIVNFIYDLVPVLKPQFSHSNTVRNFITYLYSVYQYADLVLFDSRSTEFDFFKVKNDIGNIRDIPSRVIKLGSDILSTDIIVNNDNLEISKLLNSKYLLFVGTVEPRKSQELLLNAFENIRDIHPDTYLVFVGKAGWDNDLFINRLKNSAQFIKNRVYWLQGIDDILLRQLYQNAYMCVYLSKYEGFGLPIAESLGYGKLTITSNNSSMFEVGKNCADYLNYNTTNELVDILNLYLSNTDLYQKKLQFIQENYINYTWEMTSQSIISSLADLTNPRYPSVSTPNKIQFVFISIDIEKCRNTISKLEKYISFVKECLIITNDKMINEFLQLKSSIFPIKVINENLILGKYANNFQERDHVSKNWILRNRLLHLEDLDNLFIMIDDDNQPLHSINLENFISNGRYNAYYFYDILSWNERMTDYDEGIFNEKEVLDKDGYELLAYSCHRPQIIDKRIFKEMSEKYFDIGLKKPLDEWNMYFNYAVSNYPSLFNKRVFDTLNWPGNYPDWQLQYIPKEYNFNNYYPENEKLINIADNQQLINFKMQSLKNYQKNIEYEEGNASIQAQNEMVHGVLSFKTIEGELYLLSIPYYFEAKKGTWITFPVNLKWIGDPNSQVEVGYFIGNSRGHFISVPKLSKFDDRNINLKISCISLEIGKEYDLFIDVKINGKNIYGSQSPYLVKLFII